MPGDQLADVGQVADGDERDLARRLELPVEKLDTIRVPVACGRAEAHSGIAHQERAFAAGGQQRRGCHAGQPHPETGTIIARVWHPR